MCGAETSKAVGSWWCWLRGEAQTPCIASHQERNWNIEGTSWVTVKIWLEIPFFSPNLSVLDNLTQSDFVVSLFYCEKVSQCVRKKKKQKQLSCSSRAWEQKWMKYLKTVLNILACYELTRIPMCIFWTEKAGEKGCNEVTKWPSLPSVATTLCMVTKFFVTHREHVENICPPWSFGYICTINASLPSCALIRGIDT